MSLYNMINGFSSACVFILPMLGRKHEEYPRFRDCFVSDDNERILIYTRVGGGNRWCGYGEEELYKDENFVETYDDEFDNTYATYEFKVPDKWKKDFELMMNGKMNEVSDEYVNVVKSFYPSIAEEIEKVFRGADMRGEQDE